MCKKQIRVLELGIRVLGYVQETDQSTRVRNTSTGICASNRSEYPS